MKNEIVVNSPRVQLKNFSSDYGDMDSGYSVCCVKD
jgi:hypothetical protein